MVQMNSVKGAYTKVGSRKRGGSTGRYVFYGAMVVLVFIIMNSGKKKSPGLRAGETEKETHSDAANHDTDPYMETDVLTTLETAKTEVEEAEATEVAKDEESILSTAMKSATDYMRDGMSSLLGDAVSTEEVEEMAHEAEAQLEHEVADEFHSAADQLTSVQVGKIELVYAEDQEKGLSDSQTEQDVWNQEHVAISTVANDVKESATDIASRMHSRAQEIEKQILEERLSHKLGKTVKLVFVEDEIQGEDMDDLLAGLKTLGGATSGSPVPPVSSSTYGTHAEPQYTTPYSTSTSHESPTESSGFIYEDDDDGDYEEPDDYDEDDQDEDADMAEDESNSSEEAVYDDEMLDDDGENYAEGDATGDLDYGDDEGPGW